MRNQFTITSNEKPINRLENLFRNCLVGFELPSLPKPLASFRMKSVMASAYVIMTYLPDQY